MIRRGGRLEACRPTDVPSPTHREWESYMNLPSQLALFLSVLLVILALLVRYANVAISVVNTRSFETLLVGFLILLAGVVF